MIWQMFLSASDVVVGSAGATSLSEITALGKPSIIIPKAYTAENHQEYNARSVADNGGGICILESELNSELLKDSLTLDRVLKTSLKIWRKIAL